MLNTNSILKVSKTTLARFEPKINNGTLFLFNAERGVVRKANSDMNMIFSYIDGNRNLGEICDLVLKSNPGASHGMVGQAVSTAISMLYDERFVELVK